MIESKDILNYVKEVKPTGDFREDLERVARRMFEFEMKAAFVHLDLTPWEKSMLEGETGHAKLLAVKEYKRRTGCKLLEAKQVIEEYMVKNYGVKHFQS